MALHSDYLYREGETVPSPGLKSPPSTRPFSALPVVTSFLYQGLNRIYDRLRSPIQAIDSLHKSLEKDPDVELCNKPETGILCFRILDNRIAEEDMNQYLNSIYEEVNSEGEHSISYTKLGGKAVLRIVAITTTTAETLMKTVEYVKDKARKIANRG